MSEQPKKEQFNQKDSLVLLGGDEARVCKNRDLVDVNGWLLYVHEAEQLRDWLNEVLP